MLGFQFELAGLEVLACKPASRRPKDTALESFAWARGCSSSNPQLGALRLLLDAACCDCSEACIDELTLLAPPWLEGWVRRWVPGGCRRVSLVVLQAYSAVPVPLRASHVYNIGRPAITSSAPAKTVYLPWLPLAQQ